MRKDNAEGAVQFKYFEEIAREMANRKNFTGNFKITDAELARSAQAALDLRSFKKTAVDCGLHAAEFGYFALQVLKLLFQLPFGARVEVGIREGVTGAGRGTLPGIGRGRDFFLPHAVHAKPSFARTNYLPIRSPDKFE